MISGCSLFQLYFWKYVTLNACRRCLSRQYLLAHSVNINSNNIICIQLKGRLDMWTVMLIPLIGAAIGYGTNWLAVKMLFLPYTEKRFWRVKLPFTPGCIPREIDLIAESIGRVISQELLSESTIMDNLSRPGVRRSIADMIDKRIKKLPWLLQPLVIGEIKLVLEEILIATLKKETPNIIRGLDISSIIEERIKSLPLPVLESLILQVSGRHLRSIVILGGFIGFCIGLVQLAFII
ncbi:DUF445 domain-containing protein [candidate division KSB1 bacterium]